VKAASYDEIVIGTGQSGPYVTSRLAAAGMKVAVIERKVFGGTCVNTGCIPTKTMVASAYAARVAARAAEYGVDVGPVRVDMKRVKARKDEVSKQSRVGLEDWLEHDRGAPSLRGNASDLSAFGAAEPRRVPTLCRRHAQQPGQPAQRREPQSRGCYTC
jgi:pyruvate/2-oxoglutarate dehydrogenase complex dihydrolipoamide dehydrogenase (E3) component